MKKLTDLSLFTSLFKPNDIYTIMTYNPVDDGIPHADLEESLKVIQRRYAFPLKSAVLDYYTNDRITLLGSKRVNVVTSMPAWRVVKGTPKRCHVFVNAVPYIPASSRTEMNHRRIYTLLQIGAVLAISYDHERRVLASSTISRLGSGIYARMMLKVVDRVVTLGRDMMYRDHLRYVFAKYFLVNMMERPSNETTDGLARSATSGKTSRVNLETFEETLVSSSGASNAQTLYDKNIMDFLKSMSQSDRKLSRMTVRSFIQTYIKLYGAPATFAMEEIGYFLAIMASHTTGAELVYSFSLDPVVGTYGDDMISELSGIA